MHRVNGTGNSPSLGRPTPGVVKQDKSSGGSVDTTKTRSGPQRVRMSGGERPIGAAKGKQLHTEAFCQPPPPPLYEVHIGLTADSAYGEGHSANENRPWLSLYKLRPSPSHSGRRDCINLGPDLIRYQCSAAT